MDVRIRILEAFMGEVNRDLNGRRGRLLGMDTDGGMQVISAHVPQAELFSYATELRSITGGRGTFSATLDHYEDVPSHLAERIIQEPKKSRDQQPLSARPAAGHQPRLGQFFTHGRLGQLQGPGTGQRLNR